jgi:hypothetical protein
MADKMDFPLALRSEGSSVPMAGGEEFSLQPCTQAEESAPKRKKAPTAGLDGCAPKQSGEEVNKEEPCRAVDPQLTALEGEEGDHSSYEEFMEGIKARYAANVQRLLGNHPNVVWVDFPACCVHPPGVDFSKPPSTPSRL